MLERNPDADDDLGDRIPYPFPVDPDSDLQQWLAELQVEVDNVDDTLEVVLDSLQVENASDRALDELGKDYGTLGRRRGRDDGQYRSFLLGLVAAYDGRGTPPGLCLAIAVGILADQDDVSLIEDFSTNEYEVELYDWEAHKTGTVHTLANVADPSVVERRDPLYYFSEAASVTTSTDSTDTTNINNPSGTASAVVTTSSADTSIIEYLLDGALLTVSMSDTSSKTTRVGLSGHQLGNGNQLGDGM